MPPADGDAAAAADATGPRSVTYALDPRSVLLGLAAATVVVAGYSVVRSSSGVLMLVLGVLFAFALDPLIDRVEARFDLRRGYAVAAVFGGAALAVAGLGVAFGPATVDQARSFQDDLPGVVSELGSLPLVGGWLVEQDIPTKVEDFVSALPRELSQDYSAVSDIAETVTAAILSAFAVGLVTVALLVDGPWLVSGMQRLVSPRRRATADRLGTILGLVVGRYFAGSLLLAILQGTQVLVTGLALGVPLSPALAVWAALWNFIPQIGGAVGGVTFVAVALTQGPATALIAGAIFMVYLTFANNVLLPVIVGRAVDISALSTMVATIVGFTVGGIVGAMLAVPVVGAGKAVYVELRHPGATKARTDEPVEPGPFRKLWHRFRHRGDPDGDGDDGGGSAATAPAGA